MPFERTGRANGAAGDHGDGRDGRRELGAPATYPDQRGGAVAQFGAEVPAGPGPGAMQPRQASEQRRLRQQRGDLTMERASEAPGVRLVLRAA